MVLTLALSTVIALCFEFPFLKITQTLINEKKSTLIRGEDSTQNLSIKDTAMETEVSGLNIAESLRNYMPINVDCIVPVEDYNYLGPSSLTQRNNTSSNSFGRMSAASAYQDSTKVFKY